MAVAATGNPLEAVWARPGSNLRPTENEPVQKPWSPNKLCIPHLVPQHRGMGMLLAPATRLLDLTRTSG